MMKEMQALELDLQVFPSDTNFIFFKVNDATSLQEFMHTHDIILRQLSDSHCRISIGLECDNRRFIELLKQWGSQQ